THNKLEAQPCGANGRHLTPFRASSLQAASAVVWSKPENLARYKVEEPRVMGTATDFLPESGLRSRARAFWIIRIAPSFVGKAPIWICQLGVTAAFCCVSGLASGL